MFNVLKNHIITKLSLDLSSSTMHLIVKTKIQMKGHVFNVGILSLNIRANKKREIIFLFLYLGKGTFPIFDYCM